MNRQERRRIQREEEKKKRLKSAGQRSSKSMVRFVCLQCNVEEDIPKEVVEYCDAMDDGDISVPPRFSCEKCGGEMIPKKYKGVHGIQYEY
jgi:hypothetical protein